mgnify:FL=1
MTAPNAAPASPAPRVNPLQRLWLRELGMERLWLRPAPAPVPQVVVSKEDSAAIGQASSPPSVTAGAAAQIAAAAPAVSADGIQGGMPPAGCLLYTSDAADE